MDRASVCREEPGRPSLKRKRRQSRMCAHLQAGKRSSACSHATASHPTSSRTPHRSKPHAGAGGSGASTCKMAAAAAATPASFHRMTAAELGQWVDANPTRVNDWDQKGITPLYAAVYYIRKLSLVLWLLDERGADLNTRVSDGQIALHAACSLEVLNVLLDRGAGSILLDDEGGSPLMYYTNLRPCRAMTAFTSGETSPGGPAAQGEV